MGHRDYQQVVCFNSIDNLEREALEHDAASALQKGRTMGRECGDAVEGTLNLLEELLC